MAKLTLHRKPLFRKFILPLIVSVVEELPTTLEITDRERIWNILFDIDLVIWVASFFFTLPSPWNIVYHALSDGFFALWIARLIIIRDRYYKLK